MRLLHLLTGEGVISRLIGAHRLRQQIIDGAEAVLPVQCDIAPGQSGMLLFRHQPMTAIQHRLNVAQRFLKSVHPSLNLLQRLAVCNHATDVTESALHFVAFTRRKIDADRTFEVFKHFEIGGLHFPTRLVVFLLLVELDRFIQPVLNILDQRRVAGLRRRAGAEQDAEQSEQQKRARS